MCLLLYLSDYETFLTPLYQKLKGLEECNINDIMSITKFQTFKLIKFNQSKNVYLALLQNYNKNILPFLA